MTAPLMRGMVCRGVCRYLEFWKKKNKTTSVTEGHFSFNLVPTMYYVAVPPKKNHPTNEELTNFLPKPICTCCLPSGCVNRASLSCLNFDIMIAIVHREPGQTLPSHLIHTGRGIHCCFRSL